MKGSLHTVLAFGSFVLGLLAGVWLWQIPLVGLPMAVVGLASGIISLKSHRHKAALAGTIINLVAVFLVLLNLAMELLLFPGML